MTHTEFAKAIAYLTAACGKSLPLASHEPYFDLLGDLEYENFLNAAKKVVLAHPWPSFPSIAELRAAATTNVISIDASGKAWEQAWRIIGNTDPEVDGSFARASRNASPLVLKAIQQIGLCAMCYGKDPITVMRAQFCRIYDQIAEKEKQNASLPPKLQVAIAGKPAKQIASGREVLGKALNGIGTLD